ncbi:hypothetical protein L1D29_15295 [Shewanella insulae]|uniref:hypothetical protein n=1 Tax=Shewanella insulae TaxID=2681496 RepID=UPI001EFEDF7F|nr:hypothetical protein [Shewanella insulae]MCG9714185.1 hypothetical protein [Shewanella insulae]
MKSLMKIKALASVFSGFCVIATFSTAAIAADDKGCWSGSHSNGSCLKYSSYEKDNKTYIELRNACTDRLYMKWCADDKCGVDGLRGGQTKKKYEYTTNARVRAWAVGSNNPSSDWVCNDRVGGW